MTTTTLHQLDSLAERYRVVREIGRGGMASVYLAHDLKHERDVAIKLLHPELAAALGGERFLAEIKTTARLQHPHILPLLDSGDAGGQLFYVMPYVAGESLRDRLDREHLLPIDDALRIGRAIAGALEYAHGLGVVHRDIKPENILLQDGHALVADFGIALAVQNAGGTRMTQTGLSLGTPQYMSPEQAMGERTIDGRSDVYALGAVVYEMLAGDPPFTGSTVQAIVARVMTEKPPPIAPRRERVAPHVEAAVLRALEKLPADRWGTAREFSEALGRPDGASGPADSDAARGSESRRPRSARPFVIGAAIVVIALGLGWLGGRWMARGDAKPPLTETSILPPVDGSFGERQSLALSPDGRQLAFVFATATGARSLWLRQLDAFDAKPIAGSDGADSPFWSPDGTRLGFFARGALYVVDLHGDTRQLCTVAEPTNASWGRGDVIFFGSRGGVSMVPAAGGACRVLVQRNDAPTPRVAVLPDGKRFLYSRGRRGADLVIADETGRALGTLPLRTTTMFAVIAPDYLAYTDDHDPLAVDIRAFDQRSLTWSGPAMRLLNGVRASAGLSTFSVSVTGALAYLPGSADRAYQIYHGGRVADTVPLEGAWTVAAARHFGSPTIALAGNTVGLWLYDLATRRLTRVAVHDSVAGASGVAGVSVSFPAFSPDGKRVALLSHPLNDCELRVHDLLGDSDRVLLRTSFIGSGVLCPWPLDWFPDGGRLLIRHDAALQIMTLDGRVVATISRPGTIWEARISPDGSRIAYASDETGRGEVYVQRLPTGLPARVSLDGGRWPNWSDDGRSLYFMTPDGRVQQATIDGRSSAGAPKTLFDAPLWQRSMFDDNGVGLAVVGNGEWFVVRQSASARGLAYVQNWRALLAR